MLGVNKLMENILDKYSPAPGSKAGDKIHFIQLIVNNTQLNKFDGWEVDVLKITIYKINHSKIILKPSDIADMFDGRLQIRFSKNNRKRIFMKNKAFKVNIDAVPEKYNGISYYPSETFGMTTKEELMEVRTLTTNWSEVLQHRKFGSIECEEELPEIPQILEIPC